MTKEIVANSSQSPITQKVTCPVCFSQLREMTKGHINTKKHTKALKSAGIEFSEDPALELIPIPKKKIDTDTKISRIEHRITNLEDIMYQLLVQQEKILNYYNITRTKPKKIDLKELKTHEVLAAIHKCAKRNRRKNPWVKIDDLVEILKLKDETEIVNLNKLLASMFNKKMIDLADAGNSKHPIIFQNRTYGKVASKIKPEGSKEK